MSTQSDGADPQPETRIHTEILNLPIGRGRKATPVAAVVDDEVVAVIAKYIATHYRSTDAIREAVESNKYSDSNPDSSIRTEVVEVADLFKDLHLDPPTKEDEHV
jgi:hypothetical protein